MVDQGNSSIEIAEPGSGSFLATSSDCLIQEADQKSGFRSFQNCIKVFARCSK